MHRHYLHLRVCWHINIILRLRLNFLLFGRNEAVNFSPQVALETSNVHLLRFASVTFLDKVHDTQKVNMKQ